MRSELNAMSDEEFDGYLDSDEVAELLRSNDECDAQLEELLLSCPPELASN